MSYRKPFSLRSPDFRRVDYRFTYATEAAARAAFESLTDKRYTLDQSGNYSLPLGHRLRARDEALDGRDVTFVAQIKAADLAADDARVLALESEVAGADGRLESKAVA